MLVVVLMQMDCRYYVGLDPAVRSKGANTRAPFSLLLLRFIGALGRILACLVAAKVLLIGVVWLKVSGSKVNDG